MKKVFVVVLVLAVVLGSVFAVDENHSIHVKADVTSVAPVFALRLDTPKAGSEMTNDSKVAFSGAEYNEKTAVDTGFNLDEGGTVNVSAMLLNAAKQIKVYTFEFGGGIFDTTVNGEDHDVVPVITVNASSFANVDGCGVAATDASASVSGTTNKIFKATFDGRTVTSASQANLVLASAAFVYAPTDVDLKADNEGFYETAITLKISTT